MSTISERLKVLIEAKTGSTRRHKEMEELTSLPAALWKAWWHGKQRPNEEMLQAVAQSWPEYAFWLVTGIDDLAHGHNSPLKPLKWPRTAAADYFKKSLEVSRFAAQHPEPENDEHTRMEWMLLMHDLHMRGEARSAQEATILKLEK